MTNQALDQIKGDRVVFYFYQYALVQSYARLARHFYRTANNLEVPLATRKLAREAYKRQSQLAREAIGWCRAYRMAGRA